MAKNPTERSNQLAQKDEICVEIGTAEKKALAGLELGPPNCVSDALTIWPCKNPYPVENYNPGSHYLFPLTSEYRALNLINIRLP